ncbi:MAG: hypothetical protein JRH11_02955, partial [Deltaproteobacteria bacterium]|nr:hypothetical protein [Deltaproteobacteria bacterium]
MRQFLIVSLLTALYGCSAPIPEASTPVPAATGKADGQCIFGSTLSDIVDSGRFYVDDPESLDAHTRFGRDEEAALLAGMPPSVQSLEAVFAWVDGGQVVRRSIESDENPGEDRYVLFTYELDQETAGFLVAQGTTHVAAFLVDDRIEGCNAVISAPTGGGQCLFGGTVDDLMAGFFSGDFDYTDDEKLTIDSELTAEQARQLGAMIPVGGGGIDELFAQADDGEIEVGILVSKTTDHDAFTFYSYDQDGAQMGFIYVIDSLERVAMLSDGV